MTENLEEYIYDWNVGNDAPMRSSPRKIEFDDETLRDGLQSPSVKQPSIEEKLRILHFMHALGIDNADIGLPSAGPHVQEHVEQAMHVSQRCGPNEEGGCQTDQGDLGTRWGTHRSRPLHRVFADPTLRGRVGYRRRS